MTDIRLDVTNRDL